MNKAKIISTAYRTAHVSLLSIFISITCIHSLPADDDPLMQPIPIAATAKSERYEQSNTYSPTSVSLKYSEAQATEKTTCSGGGLLGAMNCVTTRIENAGAGSGSISVAALQLKLTPVLTAEGNRREVTVTVHVDNPSPSFSGKFKNQQQVEASTNSDSSLLQTRLKQWTSHLMPAQLDDLKSKGITQVRINIPFQNLNLLALEKPPAVLTLQMPAYAVDLTFLIKSGNEYAPAPEQGVQYGDIFVLQALFTQPQSDPSLFVELNWDGASIPYEARLERVNNTGKLYRSHPLRAGFLNGPKVEIAVNPGE
ncbi:MAG: hypothetical protein HOM11_00550 [Methylococcales bacterium]|jgi:hypothetical protein|nr:hypothetical protein [Methylococcales bacterium]MBT7444706.1 hypothetical protein [Methylococcales bacterium]